MLALIFVSNVFCVHSARLLETTRTAGESSGITSFLFFYGTRDATSSSLDSKNRMNRTNESIRYRAKKIDKILAIALAYLGFGPRLRMNRMINAVDQSFSTKSPKVIRSLSSWLLSTSSVNWVLRSRALLVLH
jgi:hypothetical protein